MTGVNSLPSILPGVYIRPNSLINIVLGVASLLTVLTIMYSSIAQKTKEASGKAFLVWTGNLAMLLVAELTVEVVCLFIPATFEKPILRMIYRISFVLDFFFYNMLCVSYYKYIATFVKPSKEYAERLDRGYKFARTQVFILAIVFASSFYTGWFFTIDSMAVEHYTKYYLILEFVAVVNWHFLLIPFRLYRRQWGNKNSFILSSYIWIPIILLPFDYICNTTLSYAAYSFAALLIYMEVDIKQTKERALLEAKVAQAESKMKDMQVDLMMSQIHPHFLYNTLSTISCLCRQNPEEAEAATNEFSDYLRANLSSINAKTPIPFTKELKHAESYLKIQKRRFPDNLNVEYDVKTLDFMLPALTLQTIVENSVKHSVEVRYEMTTIRISTDETPDEYLVTVEDDGPGFDTGAPLSDDRPHIGINSTRNRLKEMSNGNLLIESTPGVGTKVTIIIPKKSEDNSI